MVRARQAEGQALRASWAVRQRSTANDRCPSSFAVLPTVGVIGGADLMAIASALDLPLTFDAADATPDGHARATSHPGRLRRALHVCARRRSRAARIRPATSRTTRA